MGVVHSVLANYKHSLPVNHSECPGLKGGVSKIKGSERPVSLLVPVAGRAAGAGLVLGVQ